jgi:hypothetical protein
MTKKPIIQKAPNMCTVGITYRAELGKQGTIASCSAQTPQTTVPDVGYGKRHTIYKHDYLKSENDFLYILLFENTNDA